MKKVIVVFLLLYVLANVISAQVRVERNADYYLADLYVLQKINGSSNITRNFSPTSKEGPAIGKDPINNTESCGIRVIKFLGDGNVGENPRATRQNDLATLRITMNNVYLPYQFFYPVFSQSSWVTHYYVVVLLDNSVASKTKEQQWSDIWNSTNVVARKRYDDLTPIDIKSLINQSNSDRITFGIRAEYSNDAVNNPWAAPSSSILGFVGTVLEDEQISVTVKNNFNGGKIKAQVDTPPSTLSNSPATITNMTRKTLYMEAVEGSNQPVFENYTRVWNDTEGPINKSNWYKEDQQGVRQPDFSSNTSTSVVLSSSEKNYSYVADMKKLCNVIFQNNFVGVGNGGTIIVNGTQYNSPTSSFQVVELNPITASAQWHYINGIEYSFARWNDGSTSSTITFYPNATTTYTASFIGKPSNSGENINFPSGIGQPIQVTWTDNPNTYVTQY